MAKSVKYDVRSKIGEIVRLVKKQPFSSIDALADHIAEVAANPDRPSQFRRQVKVSKHGTTLEPCSRSNIRSRIRLCEELGLIHFDDGRPKLFPYEPVLETGKDLDRLIESKLLSYFERHYAPLDAIRAAIDSVRRRDAAAIHSALPFIDLSEDAFRQRLHLFTQVSELLKPHFGKTFDYV